MDKYALWNLDRTKYSEEFPEAEERSEFTRFRSNWKNQIRKFTRISQNAKTDLAAIDADQWKGGRKLIETKEENTEKDKKMNKKLL